MAHKAHVIDIDVGIFSFRKHDWTATKSEPIDAIGAFGEAEERFAVVALNAGDETNFAVEFNGPGVEDGTDSEPFHSEGIGGGIEIVAPGNGDMIFGKHGMAEAVKPAIVPARVDFIGAGEEVFLCCQAALDVGMRSAHG